MGRQETCVCGCAEDRHEHYRAGTDCAACGHVECPEFLQPFSLTKFITVWVLLTLISVGILYGLFRIIAGALQ